MLKLRSIGRVHLLIGFRQMLVKGVGIILFDSKKYYGFSYYDAAVLATTLKHV